MDKDKDNGQMDSASKEKGTMSGDWYRPAIAGTAVIVAAFVLFGGWSATARLDSAVVASGQVVVEGDRKVVQHVDGGQVAEILVSSESHVEAGDVLMRIDPIEANAGVGILVEQRSSLLAEQARLMAELGNLEEIAFPEGAGDAARAVELSRFNEGVASRGNQVGILAARIEQVEQQIEGLREEVAGNESQLESLLSERERIRIGVEKQVIPAARGHELDRTIMEVRTKGFTFASEISRLERSVGETRIQITQVAQEALERATTRLSEIRGQLAEIRERELVAIATQERSDVKAPVSGKIVGLTIQTIGQVIRPGDTVLEIVPDDGVLQVSAKMSPLYVTHVHPGLSAEVRLPSFKHSETPMTLGKVMSVSADSIVDETTRQSYYELTVSIDPKGFPEDIREQIVAGMPAEVMIVTGERTVFAYLTQPLSDAMRSGMRER